MIRLSAEENVVYTTAEEKLTDEDYNKIIPFLQDKIRAFGKIRWYFEMQDFDGWSLSAMWRDAKFDFEHNQNMAKIAMVGSDKWEKGITQIMKPFAKADIRFFEIEEKETAKSWIKK